MVLCIHLDKNHYLQLVMFFLGHCKKVPLEILYLDCCILILRLSNMEIEFYKKMAYYQTEKNLKNLLRKINIDDFLIIHRYGKILPSENIVLVLVASKHRKEGFIFKEEILDWFKKKITFWKKENFKNHSSWVEAE